MKKHLRLLVIMVIILIFGISFIVVKNYNKNEVFSEENEKTEKKKTYSNGIAMMLETGAGTGTYEMTTSNSWPTDGYVFNSTLSKCENGGELSWNDINKKVLMSGNMSDKCYVYFDVVSTLTQYVISNYEGVQGTNGIYYHDENLANSAGDNSYRYAGSSVNNYICINSDAESCPVDNLYRTIGVFNNTTKIIKSSSYGGKIAWDSASSGTWADSSLNATLNSTYLNTYLSEIKDKIVDATWNVGILNDSSYVFKSAYIAEKSQIYSSAKIGLITVSDYLYTFSSDNWTINSNNLSGLDSWMFLSEYDWTLNIYDVLGIPIAWVISVDGRADASSGYTSMKFGYARPVLYLNSDVNYAGGDGSLNDPIRIN